MEPSEDLRWRANSMKLIGKLKKQVENTNDKEEAKKIIADAGMELTDDELDMVAGGERTCINKPDVHLFWHA